MNPPTALAGAMNRERKPFTYTPGGLDLSEIKSERMAKRLMRNAMNQGVPDTPVQTIQSPPPSASMAMPNFNCLPVQVFPTFNLPANPKTLLRTRSNPDPIEKGPAKIVKPIVNEFTTHSVLNKVIENNKLHKHDDISNANNFNYSPTNYGSGGHTSPYLNNIKEVDLKSTLGTELELNQKPYESIRPVYFNVPQVTSPSIETDYTNNTATRLSIPLEDNERTQNEKEEVTVTNERTNKETNSVSQNGNTEAAVTVKLPTKKSEAKTETKVEVVKNTLPDGSVQEVKTTTTKTTIDGRTEIKTETETTTYPKGYEEGTEYEEEVVEEEEEETDDRDINESSEVVTEVVVLKKSASENGVEINGENEKEESNNKDESVRKNGELIVQEVKHESSSTKKVVIQSETQDSEEEIEEVEENETEGDNVENVSVEEVIILKQSKESTNTIEKKETSNDEDVKLEDSNSNIEKTEDKEDDIRPELEKEEEIEEEEEEEEEEISEKYEDVETEKAAKEEECEVAEEEEVEEEYEEVEDVEESEEPKKTEEVVEETEIKDQKPLETELPKDEEKPSESESSKEEETPIEYEPPKEEEKASEPEPIKEDETKENIEPPKEVPIKVVIETEAEIKQNNTDNISEKPLLPPTINIPLREPSIPLEKVEEIEIKPIGPAKEVITKTTTEIITKTSDKPAGTHSTQTEYNIVENFVTVNRTTKTLDHAYEEIPDNIPTSRSFVSSSLDRSLISPQPVYKPYQPIFNPETQTERRHSLLLDRISVDRQMPSDLYQNSYQNTQSFEERQWSQEPQSEVLTVSNVKPSTISKNQQWYQRNEMETSYPTSAQPTETYNNQYQNQYKAPAPPQNVYQPKPTQPASQPIYQPQPRIQPSPQPTYQAPVQPTYHQNTYQPKPQMQHSPQPTYQQSYGQPNVYLSPAQSSYQAPVQPVQSIYQPEPQYQSKYTENTTQSTYQSSSNNYQPSQPVYTSKPIWAGKSVDPQPQPYSSLESNQYSYLTKDSTENIQHSTQQISSSYVPPPWEQDSNYVVNNSSQYQAPTTPITPSKEWKPPKPASKFSKPTPTAFIPPAPNQSFVKPVNAAETARQPGRKTYYSEYERRYISVPETTYIPHETKYQPQPDPSPQYYYDNNEPAEVVEPQWRKELREFKEQSQTTIQTETNVRPPWEDDPKYATPKDFTPTPTWTQTLKPRSWRERSYEPEYIGSQEWPKTNTLGRGRPQSSYVKGNLDRVPDRTRGVSVDRYNPNSYQSPLTKEHPPPASHILDPIIQGKTYHNPNVPAYHSRASAEPREQPISYQQPRQRESRATPVQSRSFKYLQWITGTED